MKKRMLALMLITVLSLAAIAMSPVALAATVTSYYDIDFDQKGDTDSAWKNKAGDLFFGYWSGGSMPSPADVKQTLAVDAIRGNKAVKISNSGRGGNYALGNPAAVAPEEFNSCVTWYELSFKFEEAFLQMYLESAGYPFHFTTDGSLYIGGLKSNVFQGDRVNYITFETDEWYHLVIAADNIDKFNGETKYYAWINGEEVVTNTTAGAGCADTTMLHDAAVFGSTKRVLYVTNDSTTTGKVWLDNYKVYTTDAAVKVNGTLTYDPNVIYEGAELSSDQLKIEDNVIYVPAGATLADVAALLHAGSAGAAYFDGSTTVTGEEMSTVTAEGKFVYARSDSGIGVRKYTIETDPSLPPKPTGSPKPSESPKPTELPAPSGSPKPSESPKPTESPKPSEAPKLEIVDNYYDVDYEQAGDTNTLWTNKAGSLVFGYCSGATSANANLVTQALAEDAVREGKAAKLTARGNAQAANTFYALGQLNSNISGLGSRVTWYELSFKFDKQFLQTYLLFAGYPFHISAAGELYIGGLQNNATYQGRQVNNFTLQTGEWYHMVIAADNLDTYMGDTKYYAWINGEYLTTDISGTAQCTSTQSGDTKSSTHALLYFFMNTSGEASLWVDNLKVYTTKIPVKDGRTGELCFDPNAIFEGAELSSDYLKVQDNIIYTPSSETLGGVSTLLTLGSGGGTYFNGSTAVPLDELVVTPAVGKTIYARSNSGIGVRKYTIAEGKRLYDMEPSTAAWKKADGTTVANVSSLAAGDSITLSLNFKNDTPETKNSVLVLAAYNGTVLADYCFTDIAIPAGGGQAVTGPLKIKDTTDLSIKAYVWRGQENHTPEMTRLEMAR